MREDTDRFLSEEEEDIERRKKAQERKSIVIACMRAGNFCYNGSYRGDLKLSKTALYQKYRSSTFEEVVGQEITVRTIKNAIRQNKVGHAYLFCGPRGTGKTTMARLLAKAVNCENPEEAPCGHCANCIAANEGTHPDIIEINAANETHVEDIRDLIERARLAPMVGRHKVYIIDEVHQLSSAASSALLKTLEEPPENVIFILATTDPQKLLPTIISRCQQYSFYRIRTEEIRDHLLSIAEKEHIGMEPSAAEKIAILANGGMRDALSIMDQCASFGDSEIKEEDVNRIYGLTSLQEQIDFLHDIFHNNLEGILNRVKAYDEKGIDMPQMTDQLVDILKDAVVYAYTKNDGILRVLNGEQASGICAEGNASMFMKMMDILMEGKAKLKNARDGASGFEVMSLEMIVAKDEKPSPVTEKPAMQASVLHQPVMVEEKQEETIAHDMIEKTEDLSDDELLGMMQICNKQEKAEDMEKYKQLSMLMSLETAKYKTMLQDAEIVASGKDLIVFAVKQSPEATRINSQKENKNLYLFLKEHLGIDKMPYGVTKERFQKVTREFIERRKEGSLPSPYVVKKYEEEVKHEETPQDKIIALFGAENVKII